MERVGFELLLFRQYWLNNKINMLAEVVGSNPTRSTSVNLVKYGIILSSILTNVGQMQQQCT
jgi:hypothetical protein